MNENVYIRTYLCQITATQETNNFKHLFLANNYLGHKRTCDRREFLLPSHVRRIISCVTSRVFHVTTLKQDDPMTLKVAWCEPGNAQHLFPLKMLQLQSKSNTVCRELECKSCAEFAWRRFIFDTHTWTAARKRQEVALCLAPSLPAWLRFRFGL